MAIDTKTPLALYKANLELVLRLGTLLQENRRRWNLLGSSSTSAAIERTLAETERMLTSNDWTSLAAMPGEEFWKSLKGDAGPMQGTAQAAAANQAAFAEGLKEAFAAWQQQSMDALGESGLTAGKFDMASFMNLFQGPTAVARAPAKDSNRVKPAATRKARAKAPRPAAKKKARSAKPDATKKKAGSAKPSATKKKAKAAKPAARKKGPAGKAKKAPGKRR
ncbi:hypothetical protein [Dokdonella sp.]|uniref:hypothetical protein n=1 Tax=Dokdonella sp. TaxID=2291710 RepID=UPI00352946AE